MTSSQTAVLPAATSNALFLTLTVNDDAEAATIRRAAAATPGMADAALTSGGDTPVLGALGFGAAIWDRLFPKSRPRQLRPFTPREGPGGQAPATPADLFLHVRSNRHDLNFDLARAFVDRLGSATRVVEEVHGFRYHDGRDLTGFVDGTENPTGDLRAETALVGGEDPDFAGGSYVAIQRYIHDLDAWNALAVSAQEQIIGRTKADDIEFDGDAKLPTSHVKRSGLVVDGKPLRILRHSMPYGTVGEHGLYFVAYGASPDAFDTMLASMIEGDGHGHHDHLMGYSRPVTGANFFVPAREWLESQAE